MTSGRPPLRSDGDEPVVLASANLHRLSISRMRLSEALWRWDPPADVDDATASFVFLEGDAETTLVGDAGARHNPAVIGIRGSQKADIDVRDTVEAVVVSIPADALADMGVNADGLPWSAPDSGLVRSALSFFREAASSDERASAIHRRMLETLGIEVLVGVTLEDAASQNAEHPLNLLALAHARMSDRAVDPDYGVEMLAAELGVRPSDLRREFARHRLEPRAELRRLRVARAQEILADASAAEESIEEIAARAGFRSGSALRRAFAAEGLPSPSRSREF